MPETTTIKRPAALVKQGSLKLYTTSLRVRDLLLDHFYDIERLDPSDSGDGGYQRVLNKARAKKLADYLISGHKEQDAFLPTSIFLATEKEVSFDPDTNTISFDIRSIGPLSVVDGQHRLEGLRLAAEKCPDLLEFEVPVNIGVGLSKIAQMCHFLIVNTTQKSVDKSVEQRIYARLTDALDVEDVPSLPRWVNRIVESGDDKQALRIADYLNETEGSPWFGKINMANDDVKSGVINQRSFAIIIKRYVLTSNNPLTAQDAEKQQKIILNYWTAIANLLDNGKPSVLFKYNGVDLFSRFSIPFFTRLANSIDFKVSTMEQLLRDTFENLEGEYAGVGHPDWWLSGKTASTFNNTAMTRLNAELSKALHKVGASAGSIQL